MHNFFSSITVTPVSLTPYCVCFCCVPLTSTGMWKVVAKFLSNPQQTFSAEFVVKEHGKTSLSLTLHLNLFTYFFKFDGINKKYFHFTVLPSLEVKLTPARMYFYMDSEELSIDITAM